MTMTMPARLEELAQELTDEQLIQVVEYALPGRRAKTMATMIESIWRRLSFDVKRQLKSLERAGDPPLEKDSMDATVRVAAAAGGV